MSGRYFHTILTVPMVVILPIFDIIMQFTIPIPYCKTH